MKNFFAVCPPAPWEVQHKLAHMLTRLGLSASAIEIFERLHCWTDVIQAFAKLDRREKAETLIRAQLKIKRTPEMLVYLGDCLGDVSCYEEAWQLSNGRSSKAQRNMGFLLAQKKDVKNYNTILFSFQLNYFF